MIIRDDIEISSFGDVGITIKQISSGIEVSCSSEKTEKLNTIKCINMLKASEHPSKQLGDIGERIVADYLNGIITEDMFDQTKDITLGDGTKVEVKTQSRWTHKNAFTVYETKTNINIRKCVNVDRLIFVEFGKDFKIRLFECVDRTYKVDYPGGFEAYLFDVDKMILLKEYTDVALWCKMYLLSGTEYKWLF